MVTRPKLLHIGQQDRLLPWTTVQVRLARPQYKGTTDDVFPTLHSLFATRRGVATSPFFAHVGLAQGGGCSEAFAGAAGGEDD